MVVVAVVSGGDGNPANGFHALIACESSQDFTLV